MSTTKAPFPEVVAAVDLGSNSFHMTVARVTDGHLHVVDRLKEMVRIAAGLDKNSNLQPKAMQRAIDCLQRFGERLRDVPAEGVRAVGTNTLRRARNASEFVHLAREALGHEIEIISGIEEARLIYLGISHNMPLDDKQRLAIDIGGGSTEVIIGRGFVPLCMESLYVGCVGSSRKFFPDGRITQDAMHRCQLSAMQEFEPLQTVYRQLGWDAAVGSSGTANNIAEVLLNSSTDSKGITLAGLQWLRDAIVAAGHVDKLQFPGLQPERAPVFPGGVAIMLAAFEVLGIKRLEPVAGALREGILYDTLGRFRAEDVREVTISGLADKYRIDPGQASRVEKTALALYAQVSESWRLKKQQYSDLLRWAANLHELGLTIGHAQYHKHGAYLVQHADLPGFSLEEQQILAALVRVHRRKFLLGEFEALQMKQARAIRLAALLRISVVLHRARSESDLAQPIASAKDDNLTLTFPDNWLESRPLSRADLEQERTYLKSAGIKLRFE
jgi:exopolyphosphatase / guanosine-5'-triphosphate,3'-diphosphate pyrophosphatase